MTSGNGKELRAYSASGPLFQASDTLDEADRLAWRNIMLEARERAEVQRHALTIPAATNVAINPASAIAEKMVDEASIRAEAQRRAMAYLDDDDTLTWKDRVRAALLFIFIVVLGAIFFAPYVALWRK